jgi:hypothetical protein
VQKSKFPSKIEVDISQRKRKKNKMLISTAHERFFEVIAEEIAVGDDEKTY